MLPASSRAGACQLSRLVLLLGDSGTTITATLAPCKQENILWPEARSLWPFDNRRMRIHGAPHMPFPSGTLALYLEDCVPCQLTNLV